MNTFEAIEHRRAVKHFDPTHPLSPDDQKKAIKEAWPRSGQLPLSTVVITDQFAS
jgi:hypothetical protein